MGLPVMALLIPLFAVMVAIEAIIVRDKKGYRLSDTLGNLGCGLGQQLIGLVTASLMLGAYSLVLRRCALFHWDSSWQWPIAFIVTDFCYYWFHRACHNFGPLWAIHSVHHQSEEYNFGVALRQPWLTDFAGALFYWPLPLLGIPLPTFLIASAFLCLYQVTLHTRAVGKAGPLGAIFNTPSHHRVHHGRDAQYVDRNHGATLILWDRLFGTFTPESGEIAFGTPDQLGSWDPMVAQLNPILTFLRIKRIRGVSGMVVSPNYLVAQFTLASIAGTALLLSAPFLSAWQTAAGASFLLLAIAAIGALTDGRRHAIALESARLAIAPFAAFAVAGAGAAVIAASIAALSFAWLGRFDEMERFALRRGRR